MPQFDNPLSGVYTYPLWDFGATAGTTVKYIAGPAGMRGRLIDISIAITEAVLDDANAAHIQVGTTGDADAYAKLRIADGTAISTVFNSGNDTDAIIEADIPKDTVVMVTMTEGTDGSGVTGQGVPTVYINWFK
jgi:hypothetical protein